MEHNRDGAPATPGFLRHGSTIGARYAVDLNSTSGKRSGRIQFRTLTGTGRQFRNVMLDSSRHVLSGGIDVDWMWEGGAFQASFFLSEHVMQQREQVIGLSREEASTVSTEGTIVLIGAGLGVRFQ